MSLLERLPDEDELLRLAAKYNPLGWAWRYAKIDGFRYDTAGHAYLAGWLNDLHHDKTTKKASQMGATIGAIIEAFWLLSTRQLKVGYFFPTAEHMSYVVKDRVNPMIEASPYLQGLMPPSAANDVQLKQIGSSSIYFRGMKSAQVKAGVKSDIAIKSIPLDIEYLDEFDEMDDQKVETAMQRMGHSELGWVRRFSTPTVHGWGIDREFDLTDQRHWRVKCPSCPYWNTPDNTTEPREFPHNIAYDLDQKTGEVHNATLVCFKCRKPLDTQVGEWVAEFPSIQHKRGYQFSQLYATVPRGNLNSLMKHFLSGRNKDVFWNHRMGQAYVDARGRVTANEVLACRRKYQMQNITKQGSWMGVDVGDALHVVVVTWNPTERKKQIVFMDEITGAGPALSQLDRLMDRHEVVVCVADAQPEKKIIASFAERYAGRVFMAYYPTGEIDQVAKANEETHVVKIARTQSLDYVMDDIREQKLMLPWLEPEEPLMATFVRHLTALVKKQEPIPNSDKKRSVYIRTTDDHLAHALNYAYVGMDISGGFLAPMGATLQTDHFVRSHTSPRNI